MPANHEQERQQRRAQAVKGRTDFTVELSRQVVSGGWRKILRFALARPMTIKDQRFASGTIEVVVVSGQNAQAAARKTRFNGPSCHGDSGHPGDIERQNPALRRRNSAAVTVNGNSTMPR
jgi:hypothetical protein